MKLDMMTEQECYMCTVMHLSYFRKEADVIDVTLLDAPPCNDDMSGTTPGISFGFCVFIFKYSRKDGDKGNLHIHVHFKENDSIIHENYRLHFVVLCSSCVQRARTGQCAGLFSFLLLKEQMCNA